MYQRVQLFLRRTPPWLRGVLFFAWGACGQAAGGASLSEGLYDFDPVTAQIQQWIDKGYYAGAGLILAKDGVTLAEQYWGGYDSNSVVFIASAGKWLAAATVAAVCDAGCLNWDDPVEKWLPEFKDAKGKATLRQLFSHTSGFPPYQEKSVPPDNHQTLVESVARIITLRSVSSPGERWEYGGLAMQVGGRMAERATGKNFEELFQEKIAQPLGMTRTQFTPVDPGFGHTPMLGGGARSTVHDYPRFLAMISAGGLFEGRRVLSEAALVQMQADQVGRARVPAAQFPEQVHGTKHTGIYGLGAWRELEDKEGHALLISSPSWAGAYPWIDKKRALYGFFIAHVVVDSPAVKRDLFQPMFASAKLPALVAESVDWGAARAAESRGVIRWEPSRASVLRHATPLSTVFRMDIDGDGRPDVLERWWNGKRVRWLDENRDLLATDMRGDMMGDVLQVDMDGDGFYDGVKDISIRWLDHDHDGVPDIQTIAHNADTLEGGGGHWMVFINHDNRGVLGWIDWQNWNFDCWGYSDACNWLPNYHNGDFLKIHHSPHSLQNPSLNWENPFSLSDLDDDGVSEMAQRWCAHYEKTNGVVKIAANFTDAYIAYDLDNDSSKGNESDYDMTIRAVGLSALTYSNWKHLVPELKGDPRFDSCFQYNNWRRIDELTYIPRDKQYDAFFTYGAKETWFVFDEDDDDHRWERVEMLYPYDLHAPETPTDPWSLKHLSNHDEIETARVKPPGLAINPQADTLGDRGEFDRDNSGKGQLYIGRFDRKLHLYGAEWGAWTVDRHGAFHGGWGAPSPTPVASNLTEVVRYTDTDNNGFIDRIEFDYTGDRVIDRTINLLDWKTPAAPHPDVVELINLRKLGWKGMHERFKAMAEQSWQEALIFYRAAWRRGLTDAETDRLAVASTYGERYDHAYWLKETLLRRLLENLASIPQSDPARTSEVADMEQALIRSVYLGEWMSIDSLISRMPVK
jgi:CubicO group peptidase (beta-lactamase class C family)